MSYTSKRNTSFMPPVVAGAVMVTGMSLQVDGSKAMRRWYGVGPPAAHVLVPVFVRVTWNVAVPSAARDMGWPFVEYVADSEPPEPAGVMAPVIVLTPMLSS